MDDLKDFETSKTLGEWNKAYAKFQSLNLNVKKDGFNDHTRSKHATLPNVIETCHDGLALSGLTILQLPLGGIDVFRLLCRIVHTSGEFVQWVYTTPISKKDPQGTGSAQTYLRRYSFTSSLGLPEVDDDGNEASNRTVNVPEANKEPDRPYEAPKKDIRDSNISSAPKKKDYPRRAGKIISASAAGMLKGTIDREKFYSQNEIHNFIERAYGKQSYQQLDEVELGNILDFIKARNLPSKELTSDSSYGDDFGTPENPLPF